MAPEAVIDVLNELAAFVNDSVAAHGFACFGLRQLSDVFIRLPLVPENADPEIFLGIGDPNTPEAKQYAVWRRSEALARVAQDGMVETMLGQQWIVYLFTAWEHGFRPRLATAHGCGTAQLTFPLIGDLRLMRNDVVHHHGIASPDNTGRCDVLRHWFSVGEVILLRGEHFTEFVHRFPLADMEKSPRA